MNKRMMKVIAAGCLTIGVLGTVACGQKTSFEAAGEASIGKSNTPPDGRVLILGRYQATSIMKFHFEWAGGYPPPSGALLRSLSLVIENGAAYGKVELRRQGVLEATCPFTLPTESHDVLMRNLVSAELVRVNTHPWATDAGDAYLTLDLGGAGATYAFRGLGDSSHQPDQEIIAGDELLTQLSNMLGATACHPTF